MCGIWARVFLSIKGNLSCDVKEFEKDHEIECRGPDIITCKQIGSIEMMGCVLHLRGDPTPQPYGEDETWLLWNGELSGNNIFGSEIWDLTKNDTQQIYNHLNSSSPIEVLSKIEACFAFIYLKNNELWFGRDYLGRRSLIISQTSSYLTISSTGPGLQVPAGGIFKLDLNTQEYSLIPWPYPELITPSIIRFSSSISSQISFPESLDASVQKRLVGVGDIGVLFSGGLDSSVISALALKYLPNGSQLYLINVSFEENSPDRITALASFEELERIFPSSIIHLILVDVTGEELDQEKPRILSLLSTNDSRMDFSIAAALYFASRGQGVDRRTGLASRFNGKILMSGIGADEIFGGYSRYKSSFKHYDEAGVVREMSLDLDRLWHRNMGRDDRVVSCHSRELRFPFLDSHLWLSLRSLSLNEVTQVSRPGWEKHILRTFAKNLGFEETASYKKRAIQFGTRISQVSNRQEFGSNRKAKGWQSIRKDKNLQLEEEIEFCVKELETKRIEGNEQVIAKLKDPKVPVKDKRHLMRVHLGDYVSSIQSMGED